MKRDDRSGRLNRAKERRDTRRYLAACFEGGVAPYEGKHPEDRKAWLSGVAEMAGREQELLADFGIWLARMVLVYPDTEAAEMLRALREHVWFGNWRPAPKRLDKAKAKRPKRRTQPAKDPT